MRIPIEIPFANASRSWVSSLQSWSRRQGDAGKKQKLPSRFSIPHFDADSERMFWQERQNESRNTLKAALLLGSTGFLAFIVLDIISDRLSITEIISRLFIVLALFYLFVYLHRHPKPESRINIIAKISAILSVVALIGMLLIEGNPVYYSETWVGLLPIYFFTYGQMFMTIAETVFFGIVTMIALPVSGYLIGVGTTGLLSSIMVLQIVNLFGFCTRRQLEADARNLFQERRKAECTSENKTQFLRQLSHNLRQPLQALSCYSSVLDAAYANKADDALQPIVGKMGFAIDELNNAFNHILDIANLESGKQIPFLTAVDINVVLAALEDQFAPQAAKRGLKLNIRLRSAPPFTVYSDACILTQIIGNLIDNAIKYTVEGGVLVQTVKIGSNNFKLHVCDTGIGITDQQKHNIFKEFYRGHRRREDQHVYGMGIGLTYVLKAVEHLPGHSLSFISKPNCGSDFCLGLPVTAFS
jgi:signal transduction histidine kinase